MSQACGCSIKPTWKAKQVTLDLAQGEAVSSQHGLTISYCHLHQAAPQLLEAAKRWYTRSAKLRVVKDELDPQHELADWDGMEDLKQAIATAEGR